MAHTIAITDRRGETRWEGDAESIRDALQQARQAGADLADADLAGTDLRDADLRGADLRGADLRDAVLRRADLPDAVLWGADLTGADLTGADLTGADLAGADLAGADLTGADLTGADLAGAHLADAHLTAIRDDLWRVLGTAPQEAPVVLDALLTGRINGSVYEGPCACLVGTIAKARGCDYHEIPHNAECPIERWFLAIAPGDTPETSPIAAITADWIRAWMTSHGTDTIA